MKWGPVVALFIFALPSCAFAQVVINEVMYNPQGTDTGREWIELYNEGQSDVTMVGGSGKGSWRISDGSNHTLTDPAGGTGRGSLTILAGGYLIIANDPADFVSGEYAGGSYSVVKSSISLNNNGATLALLDGNGATVDSVSYSPSQGGNDDGSSLQRQPDGSWIAALPTPGAANSSTPYVAPTPTNSSDASQTAGQSAQPDASSSDQTPQASDQNESFVPPPSPDLYADAGGDRTVIVGADAEFDGLAYDKTQTMLDPSTVRFIWNFGDGSTAEGSSVMHHFSYPGRYAVELEIADDKNAAGDQILVTAEPAALSFSLLPDGGVQIQNLAGHDLDLSDWIVRENGGTFAAQFMLPEYSKILSGSSMDVSPQTLSFRASSSTVLDYPNGAPALTIGENSATTSASADAQYMEAQSAAPIAAKAATGAAPSVKKSADSSANPPDPAPIGEAISDDPATDSDDTVPAPQGTSTVLQPAAVSETSASTYLWWFGVFALALAAAAGIFSAAHFKKDEWDIAEDKPG